MTMKEDAVKHLIKSQLLSCEDKVYSVMLVFSKPALKIKQFGLNFSQILVLVLMNYYQVEM